MNETKNTLLLDQEQDSWPTPSRQHQDNLPHLLEQQQNLRKTRSWKDMTPEQRADWNRIAAPSSMGC